MSLFALSKVFSVRQMEFLAAGDAESNDDRKTVAGSGTAMSVTSPVV